jgi:hypothetical protein
MQFVNRFVIEIVHHASKPTDRNGDSFSVLWKKKKNQTSFFSFLVAGLFSATERCADVASQQVLKERQPSASFVGREW